MTRTERAVSPRAIIKDRSESKTGLDKSLRKGGAGTHNWGSIDNERELEDAAFEDEQHDIQVIKPGSSLEGTFASNDVLLTCLAPSPSLLTLVVDKKLEIARSPSMSDEEVKSAKQFRKNAFKGDCSSFLYASLNLQHNINPLS